MLIQKRKSISNALAGAGVGAVGECEVVDAEMKPCVVGPYASGGFGHNL